MLGDEPITRAYDINADYWISLVRSGADPYQQEITDPALLAAIGEVEGLHILDAGCGEGYLARRLEALGAAQVTGIDTCRAFIDAATAAPTQRCRFLHADVADIPLTDSSMDLVVVNRLPNGLTRPGQRYHEFARLLRPGGRLICLGQHPCFYTARSERTPSDSGDAPVAEYFDGRIVQQHFSVDGQASPAPTVQKLYSLEEYLGMITDAGFVITRIREPHPTTDQLRTDPQWGRLVQRPLFLLVEAKVL